MESVRENIKNNVNGVITVMLREAAMIASQDPTQLGTLEVNIKNENEATLERRAKSYIKVNNI